MGHPVFTVLLLKPQHTAHWMLVNSSCGEAGGWGWRGTLCVAHRENAKLGLVHTIAWCYEYEGLVKEKLFIQKERGQSFLNLLKF